MQEIKKYFRDICVKRIFLWQLLFVSGFCYVAYFLCGQVLFSRESLTELLKLMCLAPLLYFFSGRFVLRNPGDEGALKWNIAYCAVFFLSLHWYYLQFIKSVNYSLTLSDLRNLPPVAAVVFVSGAFFIALLAFYHFRLARKRKILAGYLITFWGGIVLIAFYAYLRGRLDAIHIHHYFLAAYILLFLRFRTPVTMICSAFCAGVCVEGIAEWGMDPLF